MSGEPSELENSIEEFIKKIMAYIPISKGIHAFLTRGLQASPSTEHRSTRINPKIEHRSKQRGDLANTKSIPSILNEYVLPMASVVNCDSIPQDLITPSSLRTF